MFLLKKCEKCSKILHTTKPPFPLSVRLVRFWATYSEKVTPENAGTTGQVLTKTATGASWQDASLGLLPQVLVTIIGRPAESVTATMGGKTVALTYDSTDGVWTSEVDSFGVWAVTATDGTLAVTNTVDVDTVRIYEVSMQIARLPVGYTELEYIESTGTQYINTGLVSINGDRWTGEVMFTSLAAANVVVGSQFGDGNAPGRNMFLYETSGNRGWSIGNQVSNYIHGSLTANINTRYIFNASAVGNATPRLTINGEDVSFPSNVYPSAGVPTVPVYIFALNVSGQVYGAMSGRLYGALRIYSTDDDSGLRGEFYPAKRRSDDAVGMYDTVSGAFFPNAGSDSFTAGPEV